MEGLALKKRKIWSIRERERGASLLSILAVFSLVGIFAFQIADVQKNSFDMVKNFSDQIDETSVLNAIELILSDEVSCTRTFESITFVTNNTEQLTALKYGSGSTDELIRLGQNPLYNGVNILEMRLDPYLINLNYNGTSPPSKLRVFKFTVRYQKDGGTGATYEQDYHIWAELDVIVGGGGPPPPSTLNLTSCSTRPRQSGVCQSLFDGQEVGGTCIPNSLHIGPTFPTPYPGGGIQTEAGGDFVVRSPGGATAALSAEDIKIDGSSVCAKNDTAPSCLATGGGGGGGVGGEYRWSNCETVNAVFNGAECPTGKYPIGQDMEFSSRSGFRFHKWYYQPTPSSPFVFRVDVNDAGGSGFVQLHSVRCCEKIPY